MGQPFCLKFERVIIDDGIAALALYLSTRLD